MTEHQNRFSKFLHEIKRRKVVRVIIVYATTAFILIQLANILESSLNLPPWFDAVITLALIIGFPVAIIFSWIFDVSSKGIHQTESLVAESNPDKTQITLTNAEVPEKSIIVLPFENMSSDPEQEYFSDGLTEEIITDLSYVHDLLVISRSSAMTFKGSKQTIKKIASKVNVRYVLEGSVRKSANNLRITAQLIDASNDTHLWAEKYTGTMDDIFDIQEKVSRLIVDSLKIRLSQEEKNKITESKIEDFQVYECYIKSKQDLWKYTEESLIRAEQNLKNGLQLFGDHELLYAGLGQVYFNFYDSGIRHSEEYLNKLNDSTTHIFKLNPHSANGYRLSGLYKMKKENTHSAFRDFQKSYKLNPNNPETLLWLGNILCFHIGRPIEALPFINKALEIDPLTPINQASLAYYHWMEGRFDKALYYYQKWLEMEPDSVMAGWYVGQALVWNKDKGAIQFIDEVWQKNPNDIFSIFLMILKHAVKGNKEEALKLISKEMRDLAWSDWGLPWWHSGYYALINEKEESIKWLERAVEWGNINYPLFSEIDPLLENIRQEPRFKKLMKKVKKEWGNFEI